MRNNKRVEVEDSSSNLPTRQGVLTCSTAPASLLYTRFDRASLQLYWKVLPERLRPWRWAGAATSLLWQEMGCSKSCSVQCENVPWTHLIAQRMFQILLRVYTVDDNIQSANLVAINKSDSVRVLEFFVHEDSRI